jgi:hypothetical protein
MASMIRSNGSMIKEGESNETMLENETEASTTTQENGVNNTDNSTTTVGTIDWHSAYTALLQSNAGDLVAMLSAASANCNTRTEEDLEDGEILGSAERDGDDDGEENGIGEDDTEATENQLHQQPEVVEKPGQLLLNGVTASQQYPLSLN